MTGVVALVLPPDRVFRYSRFEYGVLCDSEGSRCMVGILWAILLVVLILWLLGFAAAGAGSMIHLLLIVALAILIYNLLTGRRAV